MDVRDGSERVRFREKYLSLATTIYFGRGVPQGYWRRWSLIKPYLPTYLARPPSSSPWFSATISDSQVNQAFHLCFLCLIRIAFVVLSV